MIAQNQPQQDDRWSHLNPIQREEIDAYEMELHRALAGEVDDRVFLEFRLRHGVYGQRQDGVQMLRIKIPLGVLSPAQLERIADLSEEYGVGISHITTRQDVQYHFIDIRDTPDIMRRLAEVGITTREACGNVVRNVTCCPLAGVCRDEAFDVTPFGLRVAYFLLRHPDTQAFGRKFKISFSGCADRPCALANIHDIGFVARVESGEPGFAVYVGGGLGAVPHKAKLYSDFVPATATLPLCQAIARVFARYGEKKVRSRARMKFLVERLGIDEFRRRVAAELDALPPDPRFESYAAEAADRLERERPLRPTKGLDLRRQSQRFVSWHRTNVYAQRQRGYSAVTVLLPLGDISSHQLRELARIARRYTAAPVRATVEQNLLLRWIADPDLPSLFEELDRLGLGDAGADTRYDITACPGTDSCKLGIASSRGLASVLMDDLSRRSIELDGAKDAHKLKIKISGCPNSCGQHHVGDIGLFGSMMRRGEHAVPVFQLVLGGTTENNAASYGMPIGKIPARRVRDAIGRLLAFYRENRNGNEPFAAFVNRVGKKALWTVLEDLQDVPAHGEAPELYRDNRQSWEFGVKVGVGECAGEVVTAGEFLLEEADRLCFEAAIRHEEGRAKESLEAAHKAMRTAAEALLTASGLLLSEPFDRLEEFRARWVDTGRFRRAFAEYYRQPDGATGSDVSLEAAEELVHRARLFVEEAQVAYTRYGGERLDEARASRSAKPDARSSG
jgi:sulfite reductase (ferredoxin)